MTCILFGIRNSYCTRTKRFTASLQKDSDRYFRGNYVTSQFHTINIIIIAHPPLYNITNTGKKKAVASDGVKKAAELRLKAKFLTVPEAMAEIFFDSRIAKQRQVDASPKMSLSKYSESRESRYQI